MSKTRKPKPPTQENEASNSQWGTDEMNLCEFPLAVCGFRMNGQLRSITFEDQIFDEGNRELVKRKLVISASEIFGLPTPLDSDVLLVLMHLTNCRTRFKSPSVSFTRYEVVKLLGWDQSGKSYKRLEESLNRWASVTLYYDRAWWDRDKRRWRSQTFHVLDTLELRGVDGPASANDDGLSTFTWNSVIFTSFASNHLKRIDLGTYFQLKVPAARQAYRFLDKRFYRAKTFKMELRTFACEHVGLARGYDNSELKRRLLPALKELERVGFLVPTSDALRFPKLSHGRWQIVLQRSESRPPSGGIHVGDNPLILELSERGIRTAAAARLVREFPASHISAKIELHDWLVQRKDNRISQNPAGFLAAAIRNDYQPPKNFVSRQAQEQQKAHRVEQHQVEVEQVKSAKNEKVIRQAAIKYWQSLGVVERSNLESAAIATGNEELLASYHSQGNTRFREMLLKELVVGYLKYNANLLESR